MDISFIRTADHAMIKSIVALTLSFSILLLLIVASRKKEAPDNLVLAQANQALCSQEMDRDARKRAKEAALKRQEEFSIKQRERQRAYKQQRREEHEKMVCVPTKKPSVTATNLDSTTADLVLPVFDDGLTSYRHLPHLFDADAAERMLNRIAREFTPIIRQRGYDVKSVTEFCCCGDGLDYELGGHSSCIRPGCKIEGHDQDDIEGYNRVNCLGRGGRTVHTIHLRLRDQDRHDTLKDYGSVSRTMAHELAHCVHRHHEPSFFLLMNEIIQQHAVVVRDLQLGPSNNASTWMFPEMEQQMEEFNVYQSSTLRVSSHT